jgi:AraC-like DNA-binding protein
MATSAPVPDPCELRHLYVWDRLVLQLARGLTNSRHRHFGAFLLLAPDAPITIDVDGSPRAIAQAALIAPGSWHRLDSRNSRVATLLLGPDHPWFGYIAPVLNDAAVIPLDLSRLTANVDWDELFSGHQDCEEVLAFLQRALAALRTQPFAPHVLDRHVTEAVRLLNEAPENTSDLTSLARRVGLSDVTLMRRFKRELGVRVREYALWRRLMNVLPLIDGRRTLTEIAQLAGFYDQAHLTRTSRRMFDLQPSRVAGLSRARIHVCARLQQNKAPVR